MPYGDTSSQSPSRPRYTFKVSDQRRAGLTSTQGLGTSTVGSAVHTRMHLGIVILLLSLISAIVVSVSVYYPKTGVNNRFLCIISIPLDCDGVSTTLEWQYRGQVET